MYSSRLTVPAQIVVAAALLRDMKKVKGIFKTNNIEIKRLVYLIGSVNWDFLCLS